MVYRVDANSWSARSEFPIAGFLDRNVAEEYASKQPGYGLNTDWFVQEVPFNPEV
jgi:hypothetical protein